MKQAPTRQIAIIDPPGESNYAIIAPQRAAQTDVAVNYCGCKPMTGMKTVLFVFLVLAASSPLPAAAALLVGEPYGKFGYFNPTGHAAVYLSNICAETPVRLRTCGPGEFGTVISRYGRVAGLDWIAIPPLPYFYAAEQPEDIPVISDRKAIAQLRERYRRERLQELIPDDPSRETPKGDWIQLVGSAYDRNTYGFGFETTPEEDERFIRYLNERSNAPKFNLLWRNCADFAREILNFYKPGAVRRSVIGDLGIMTPKHAAGSLVKFSRRNPGMHLIHFMIPQVAGGHASKRLRGVNESLIRSGKYVIPLIVLQPWVAASAAAAYLTLGRFNPSRYSPARCETVSLIKCMAGGEVESPPMLAQNTEEADSDERLSTGSAPYPVEGQPEVRDLAADRHSK